MTKNFASENNLALEMGQNWELSPDSTIFYVASALEYCMNVVKKTAHLKLSNTRTPKCETCKLRLIFNFAQSTYFCKTSLNTIYTNTQIWNL